jgi:hypothetical protein
LGYLKEMIPHIGANSLDTGAVAINSAFVQTATKLRKIVWTGGLAGRDAN